MGRRRAVVTGGAGFLGSHVCDRLLAEGLPQGRMMRPEDVARMVRTVLGVSTDVWCRAW